MFQSESTIRSLEDVGRMRSRADHPESSSIPNADLRRREVTSKEAAAVRRALDVSIAHEQSLFLEENEIATYTEAERLASNQHQRQLMGISKLRQQLALADASPKDSAPQSELPGAASKTMSEAALRPFSFNQTLPAGSSGVAPKTMSEAAPADSVARIAPK